MRLRLRAIASAGLALLLMTMPVQAQVEPSAVSFQGVALEFDRELGSNVNIMAVRGDPLDGDHVSAPSPGHLAFSIYGPRRPDQRMPRPLDSSGAVRFYRVSDLAGYAWAGQQLQDLQSLLAQRPDLDGLAASDAVTSSGILPFILTDGAAQLISARGQYIDTPELSGVAYLTVMAQDIVPFTSDGFSYTFQGLSADGNWYVAVDVPVDAGMFPERVGRRAAQRLVESEDRWASYRTASIQILDEAADSGFAPPLSTIDALVRSIEIDDTSELDAPGG